jgi:hypothetical protein
MYNPTNFILFIILFDEAFKYDGAKFWGHSGIDAEPECLEFGSFMRCHASVNYFTCYY